MLLISFIGTGCKKATLGTSAPMSNILTVNPTNVPFFDE